MLTLSVLRRKNLFKAIFVVVLLLLPAAAGRVAAQNDSGTCENEVSLISPVDGQNLVGEEEFILQVPDNTPAQSVEFFSGDAFIGSAKDGGSGTWNMSWDTTTAGEDAAEINAKLTRQSGGDVITCETKSTSVSIDNTEESEIEIELSRLEWAGPANFRFGFDAKVLVRNGGQTTDVTEQAKLQWVNDIGVLKITGSNAELFSGPYVKNGRITVTAYYGTLQEHVDFNVAVVNGEQANNYPFGSSDEILDMCLADALGDRYGAIVADGLRFNDGDLSQSYDCFESRNYLLPVNLAPVSPIRVDSLDVNESLNIDSIEYVENQASVVSALVIEGHAAADSNVVLYMSSEPLIALARANANGEWSYVLNDPLSAGKHEIVAVSGFDGSFYQSEGYGFSIEQSEGSVNNPEGLSLELADDSGKPLTYLVWIAVLSFVFIAALLFAIHHRTKIHHPDHAAKKQ